MANIFKLYFANKSTLNPWKYAMYFYFLFVFFSIANSILLLLILLLHRCIFAILMRQREQNPWHFIMFCNSFQRYQVFKMHLLIHIHTCQDAPTEKRYRLQESFSVNRINIGSFYTLPLNWIERMATKKGNSTHRFLPSFYFFFVRCCSSHNLSLLFFKRYPIEPMQ